jgi:carbamoyltransferase
VKILGINISHHTSICFYENGKVKNFFNEERFIGLKNFDPTDVENFVSLRSIKEKVNFKPEIVCYTSFGRNNSYHKISDYKIIDSLQKQLNNPNYYFNIREHHLYHAICGFYFSNFEEAAVIVVDAGGACKIEIPYQEIESIYFINKKNIKPFYKHYTCHNNFNRFLNHNFKLHEQTIFFDGHINKFSNYSIGGLTFNLGCEKLKYSGNDAGKLMGLSSYGYSKEKYKDLDYDKVTIAKEVQEKSFYDTSKLIDLIKDKTKNVILSGGCALNCSNNFKYVKKYPELNFFVDPIPHDAGTAIGVALYYDNYR